jgi:hypothetical protein
MRIRTNTVSLTVLSLVAGLTTACGGDSVGVGASGAGSDTTDTTSGLDIEEQGDASESDTGAEDSGNGGTDAGGEPDTASTPDVAELDAGGEPDTAEPLDVTEEDASDPDTLAEDTAEPGDDADAGGTEDAEPDAGFDIAEPLDCLEPTVEQDGECVPASDDLDLLLWLDATNLDSIGTDGSDVKSWKDRRFESGDDTSFGSLNAGARPDLAMSTWNGLPTVYFDGDDHLTSAAFGGLSEVPSYTIFVVSSSTGNGEKSVIRGNSLGKTAFALEYQIDSSRARFVHRWPAADIGGKAANVVNLVPDAPTILTAERRSGEVPSVSLAGSNPDGLAGSSEINNGATDDIQGGLSVVLGGASNGVEGHIAEVLIYTRAMADAEAEAVREYLAVKWGVGE